MRILFLSQVLPYPLDAGPKIRAYYVLRHLAQHHRVVLVSFVRPTDSPQAVDHLRSFCQAVHTVPIHRSKWQDTRYLLSSLPTATPFLIARDRMPQMNVCIRQLMEEHTFDAIHADQLWMAPYGLRARSMAKPHTTPQLVLDQHNAVYQVPRRLAHHETNLLKRLLFTLEARKMVEYEVTTCRRFDHVVWVTEEDRTALESQGLANRTQPVIPICVDPESIPVATPSAQPRRITFLGGMHWPPNADGILWFRREVWPGVAAQVPDAIFTVLGKDPPTEILQTSVGHIEVPGYVENLHPYLAETAVFVVPLHAGGGMRVKILDGWCWGLPIVSTTIGAEGIEYRNGRNILIADDAKAFTSAVVDVLTQPDLASGLRKAGRLTAEEQYNWHRIYAQWDRVYSSTV